jgi:hypothetical protein
MARIAKLEEFRGAAVYLVSDASSYVMGREEVTVSCATPKRYLFTTFRGHDPFDINCLYVQVTIRSRR